MPEEHATRKAEYGSPDQFPITFPSSEAGFLESQYKSSRTIFEYGSGGSTVLAAKLGKNIISVESDNNYSTSVASAIKDVAHASARAEVMWVDIGKVRKWGYPVDSSKFPNYHNYPLRIWREYQDMTPDTVLIDGRMRKACFLTTLAMARTELTLLFDDYLHRKRYHEVERILKPVNIVGRLAVFKVTPGLVNMEHFSSFIPWFFDLK